MRIVHVVRQFYPAVGGFESVFYELAARREGLPKLCRSQNIPSGQSFCGSRQRVVDVALKFFDTQR
jgi:hypothetical protein